MVSCLKKHAMDPSFQVEKPTPFPVGPLCLAFVEQDVSTQLLTVLASYLPAAVFPTMTVMDSNPLEL